ncbi:sugar phosphate isomerase/epimerase family protein [Evansella tamaricis]|uniref:Sugar phosphate isomerase/epimerase n=1 Tax=Evansella tamaricis TaxID=2069301 RepID=A0ABS6JEA9_9BACI|nr:sugar phosphate isomerase/epimerase family protein [Evansella tamaricis]MBU9711911.1 sugar phosphate isomerase/epimerase [Evansella tamaricis]
MLSYGISTFATFEKSVEQGIEELIRNDWKYIEIMADGPGEEILTWSREKLAIINRLIENEGVELAIHAPIFTMDLGSSDKKIQEKSEYILQKCFAIGNVFNSPYVLTHLGTNQDISFGLELASERIDKLLNTDPGMTLVIENVPPMPTLLGTNGNELLQVIDKVGHERLRVAFDTGHANIVRTPSVAPIEQFMALEKYISVVHISDNNGTDDDHYQAGKGNFPWDKWMKELQHIKQDVKLLMETKSIEEGAASKEFLGQVGYLRE